MPQLGPAIAAAGKAIGTFLTAGGWWAVARFVVFTAASAFTARLSSAFNPGLQQRVITTRGNVEPQQIVIGEALVSGPLAYLNTGGSKNADLWIVVLLAGHECESISDVWLDGQVIDNADIASGAAGGGDVNGGKFDTPAGDPTVLRITKYLGTATQTADAELVAATDRNGASLGWTTDHRLRGFAYLVLRGQYNGNTKALWDTGEPTNIRGLVRGLKLYDPRKDSTNGGSGAHRLANPATWEWSDNPALAAAWYLLDDYFGVGVSSSSIDWPTVIDAADHCDELVTVPGGSEKRFTCNGALYTTATHQENLDAILSSMNGSCVFVAGRWYIEPGWYVAPTVDLTEHDLISPIGQTLRLKPGERVNTCSAEFVDPEQRYNPSETPAIQPATFLNRDNNRVLRRDLTLPMTNSYFMAQRLCRQQVYVANQERTVRVTANLKAAQLGVGDRVNLFVDELNWQPKVFRVLGWTFRDVGGDGMGVELELREDSASAYDDPASGEYSTRSAAGLITFGDPGVEAPQSLSATAVEAGIDLSWDNSELETQVDFTEVWASATSSWSGAARIARVKADTYRHNLSAGTERFYWVRNVRDNEVSLRDPDSDTSNVSATAGNLSWSDVSGPGRPADNATVGATLGVDAFNEASQLLEDVDVRNDQLVTDALGGAVNANPTFQIPRRSDAGNLCPASWYGSNNGNPGNLEYFDDTARDVLYLTLIGQQASSAAFQVRDTSNYEVVVIARTDDTPGNQGSIEMRELVGDLPSGGKYVNNTAGEAGHVASTFGQSLVVNMALTNSFQVYAYTWQPNPGVKWASLRIGAGNRNILVEYAGVRDLGNVAIVETITNQNKLLEPDDTGDLVRFVGNSGSQSVLIPQDALGDNGRSVTVVRDGSSSVTFVSSGSPGVTLVSKGGTAISTQGGSVRVTQLAVDRFLLEGDL